MTAARDLCQVQPCVMGMGMGMGMGWLARYAKHCDHAPNDHKSVGHSLRAAFGAPAWRIVCKSPRSAFLPILRNRELSLHSLIEYCQQLAKRSFTRAPEPSLLDYFINQRRYFFDHPCRIPQGEDYAIIRVANRLSLAGHRLRIRDIALVSNWAHQSEACIQAGHHWRHLVMRAREFFESEQIRLCAEKFEPWHFYCTSTDWRGYKTRPITDAYGLWLQGQSQGNCLYKLRFECTSARPSRFFSVHERGKVIATLELHWCPPQSDWRGMDRVWGKWQLQDLRLSHNRAPGEDLLRAMTAFAGIYNEWAKRPARQPNACVGKTRQSQFGSSAGPRTLHPCQVHSKLNSPLYPFHED